MVKLKNRGKIFNFILYLLIALFLLIASNSLKLFVLKIPRDNTEDIASHVFQNSNSLDVKKAALKTIISTNGMDNVQLLLDVYAKEKMLRTDIVRYLRDMGVSFEDIKRLTSGDPLFSKFFNILQDMSIVKYIYIIAISPLVFFFILYFGIIIYSKSNKIMKDTSTKVSTPFGSFNFHLYEQRAKVSFLGGIILFISLCYIYAIPKPINFKELHNVNNLLLIDLSIKSKHRSAVPFLVDIIKNEKSTNEEKIKSAYALGKINFSIFYYKDYYQLSKVSLNDMTDEAVSISLLDAFSSIYQKETDKDDFFSMKKPVDPEIDNKQVFELEKKMDPNNPYAYVNYGLYLKEIGKYDLALKSFSDALVVEPNQKDALLGKADTYFESGKYSEARLIYENLLKINSKDTILYCYNGVTKYHESYFTESILDLEKCTSISNDTKYLKYLILSKIYAKDTQDVYQIIDKYCSIDPSCNREAFENFVIQNQRN